MPPTATPRRAYASVSEVAQYLGLNDETIRRMIAEGRLRAYRNGKKLIRLDLNEVDAAMRPIPTAEAF